jgi:hypothetical protein
MTRKIYGSTNNKNIQINKSVIILCIDTRSPITYFSYVNKLLVSIPLELIPLLDLVTCPES